MSAAHRPRTRLHPEIRREQIVEAAEKVFDGRDPGEVTFEQIAQAAGVSRGLVYNYFGNKGGLIAAIYQRSLRLLDEHVLASLDPMSDDATRLASVVRCYVQFAKAQPAAWRLIGSTSTSKHPEVQAARRDRFDVLSLSWGGTIQARTLARAVAGFLESATLDWIESSDIDLDCVADLLFTTLWSGLSSIDGDVAHIPRGADAAIG